jgi:hypothetical protein
MITTELVREELNPAGRFLDPGPDPAPTHWLSMCGWCKRIEIDREWYELEHGVKRLRLFEVADLPSFTHGICDACRDRMTALLDTI